MPTTNNFRTKIEKYISNWESKCYHEGIPDECHPDIERNKLAPSYRQICIAIMKNDYQLQYLGFNRKKCLAYMELKRIELQQKGVITQHNLF